MIINKIFFKAPNSIVFSFTCTVESFVELAKFLLDKYRKDGLFLLSERLTQDPLENYFGQQRARGGPLQGMQFLEGEPAKANCCVGVSRAHI